MASWDMDEAQGWGGLIVWQIFGCYNLTNRVKPCYGKKVDLGGIFCPFGGLKGAPGLKAGGSSLLGRE